MIISTRKGQLAEKVAAHYLARQGIKLRARNFHCRFGEIDMIACDGQNLLFVEVRYRKNENYMAVTETVDQSKCKRIITTSQYYLGKHKEYKNHFCRYDVITITGELDKSPVITWIKNAFQA